MIRTYQSRNQMIWYDDELLKESPEDAFNIDFWKQNEAVVGSASGRGTTWFVQTEAVVGALRHYRRGGLFGKLIADSYWFSGWETTRSYAEFHLLKVLADAGVNVPRPIAAQASKQGLVYRADLLSEKIPNAADLVDILQRRPLIPEEYQAIGREIAKMHGASVNHTDLNIHNILLDSHGKVWIIDFDKCYQQEGTNWQQGNLDRLLRSFHKELSKCSIRWTEPEFNHLLDGYQQAE
ncbi:3-deoxy-D-manno-octulosonic-acid kinase [Vibrio sinaloensis DSM 21326]|uniref:3-deoxy-D-manno-octulosonic acid kinase n=1 Tax=Vibrio sinaloensis DSM 21326 TaxID=945550 RepID=E8M560_PHOS4|nr:3-deoxy-D-manno-octulosonic acid kinase [Vibrio sinaloensis]EGA70911.1 3-deoxy-D-manno-octulosonic-acid kinase [Vibrio sinaloensis DSM 21326]